MSVNSEKCKNTRIINDTVFNKLYKHLAADDEVLGRKDFTIHVTNMYRPGAKTFQYTDVNATIYEKQVKTRVMRVLGDPATEQLCSELEPGCNYKILSWKQGKAYSWIAAVKIDKKLRPI